MTFTLNNYIRALERLQKPTFFFKELRTDYENPINEIYLLDNLNCYQSGISK